MTIKSVTVCYERANMLVVAQFLYLDVLVVFPELHQPVVRADGFTKVANVGANSYVVLPDLPVLEVTLECFPESMKGFLSVWHRKTEKNTGNTGHHGNTGTFQRPFRCSNIFRTKSAFLNRSVLWAMMVQHL